MYRHFKVNKYRNTKIEFDGILYDSKAEARHAEGLLFQKLAHEIKDYVVKPKYDLYGKNGNKICTIIPDFLIVNLDDSLAIEEVKSKATMTPTWRLKKKLFEDNYPAIQYRTIVY
jgi:hypothetical protein